MVCTYLGTIKGEKLNEPESDPSPICKKNSPNPARMHSACRVPMDILIGKDNDEYEKEQEKKHTNISDSVCKDLSYYCMCRVL